MSRSSKSRKTTMAMRRRLVASIRTIHGLSYHYRRIFTNCPLTVRYVALYPFIRLHKQTPWAGPETVRAFDSHVVLSGPPPNYFRFIQEILRRARMGNTRVRPAIYNPATGTYTAAPPLIPTTVKSKLPTTGPTPVAASAITPPPADIDMLDEDPEADITAQPKPTLDEDRTFTVRKWTLVPAAEADKRPEPKYLADRRPGLKNIYGFGQAQNTTTGNGDSATTGTALGAVVDAAGKEISSTGLELGSAGGFGMGTSASAPVTEMPRRRGPPPPPKRKKKGGLGRRKKASVDRTPGEQQGQGATGTDGTANGAGASSGMVRVKVEDGAKYGEDEEGSGSDDGDEGSEEGEIDEGEIMDVEPTNTTTAHEHKVDAVVPDPSTAAGKNQVDAPTVDVVEAVTLPAAEVRQVEEAMPLVASEMKDVAEEKIPPPATEMADLVEEKGISAAITNESAVQHAAAPAPPVQQPRAEEAEVDLLGSLDRAVEGMQGANADAMDIAEEKPAE
jgi:hypothetical protein